MREITPPGTGKTDLGGSRNVIIFEKDGSFLYGRKLAQEIADTDEGRMVYCCRDISLECFVALLMNQWPNHSAVKALTSKDDGTNYDCDPEMLDDIDREITLTVADAKELEYWQHKADTGQIDVDTP